jgi:hypothetical protein
VDKYTRAVQGGIHRLSCTHLSVPCEVDLQRLSIVLEAKRGHGEEDVFAIDGLALLLLALF